MSIKPSLEVAGTSDLGWVQEVQKGDQNEKRTDSA